MSATDFDRAMRDAARGGHIEIVRLLKDWGATEFNWAMAKAADQGSH